MNLSQEVIQKLKGNIFPQSWDGIDDLEKFDWHKSRTGEVDSHKKHSSQALMIDVFGFLLTRSQTEIDAVFNAFLATHSDLSPSNNWKIQMEWSPENNPLNEPRQTQVDVVAESDHVVCLFECKFTESFGSCSQPPYKCDGNYPECILSQKGIEYWDEIPNLFKVSATGNYSPCPFHSPLYQPMRNIALAKRYADKANKAWVFSSMCADPRLQEENWKSFITLLQPKVRARCIEASYTDLISIALTLPSRSEEWVSLKQWAEDKICNVMLKIAHGQHSYSKLEIQSMVHKVLANTPDTFYQQPFLNYKGVAENGVSYSDIIAEEFITQNGCGKIAVSVANLDSRKRYRMDSHKGKLPTSGKEINTEKRLAIALFNLKHIGGFEILDYQTPLKTKQNDDPRGEIDLLAKDCENTLHLIELKPPQSNETILRAALEVFTYLTTVQNYPAFKADFDAVGCTLIADVWIPVAIASTLDELPEVKRLLEALSINVYSYDIETLEGFVAPLQSLDLTPVLKFN